MGSASLVMIAALLSISWAAPYRNETGSTPTAASCRSGPPNRDLVAGGCLLSRVGIGHALGLLAGIRELNPPTA